MFSLELHGFSNSDVALLQMDKRDCEIASRLTLKWAEDNSLVGADEIQYMLSLSLSFGSVIGINGSHIRSFFLVPTTEQEYFKYLSISFGKISRLQCLRKNELLRVIKILTILNSKYSKL